MRVAGAVRLKLASNTAELEILGVVHPHGSRAVAAALLRVVIVRLAALENRQLPDVAAAAAGKLHHVALVTERLGVSAPSPGLGLCIAEEADGLVLADFAVEDAVVVGTGFADVYLLFKSMLVY